MIHLKLHLEPGDNCDGTPDGAHGFSFNHPWMKGPRIIFTQQWLNVWLFVSIVIIQSKFSLSLEFCDALMI